MNVHFALEICFVKTNLDAKTETATSKSTDTGAGFSLYGISEDGWTAELDRDYVFGESECIINGGGTPFIMLLLALLHSIAPSWTGCPAALQRWDLQKGVFLQPFPSPLGSGMLKDLLQVWRCKSGGL